MQGRHGKQLALAKLEGWGKDDLPLSPDFLDDDIDDYDDDGNWCFGSRILAVINDIDCHPYHCH